MPQRHNSIRQSTTICPWTPIPGCSEMFGLMMLCLRPLRIDLALLLLLHLQEERSVDVWQNTTERDSGSDQGVQLFITADGKLKVSRGDTLDLEILGGVACEFQDFSGQVFQDSSNVDGGYGDHGQCLPL